jgi:hypothetical protein
MSKLLAFHGDPKIKAKYLRRVRAHRKADQIIYGTYWENGKGCAVGCTIHGSDHAQYEKELGIPEELARLEDWIFENMGNGHSLEWPEKFLHAINPGADLSKVADQFIAWILTDPKEGLVAFTKDVPEAEEATKAMAELHKRCLDGKPPSEEEWMKVWQEGDRAWARAWAGAGAWAGPGAWAGARAWAGAGARAWAGARAGAGPGAWAVEGQSEKLLELLREAK